MTDRPQPRAVVPDGVSDPVTVGVDYGTLSGRAVVVRVSDGEELGSAVCEYPHAVLDRSLPVELAGRDVRLGPDWALQVPADYVEVLKTAVPAALRDAGVDPARVIGIATDFTACTMVPTTVDGTPLCELPGHAADPHAYVKLWKHHAAQPQADRINELARKRGEAWLPRYGGLISSEWEFAKGLELLEDAPAIYAEMAHFVEAADWIVWQLSGAYFRNACTAGYKGIYQDGTYPTRAFLAELNPDFETFVLDKLDAPVGQLGAAAGRLTKQAAEWTGLPEGITVAVGNVDAHVTAPAADAIGVGQMVAIMGTSTCHVMNSDTLREVPGMCGVVDGGITAGLWGYEAGQSGVGDIFNWFVTTQVPHGYAAESAERGISVHELLTEKAEKQAIGEHGLRRPRLAQRQPLRARQPRALRADGRADPGDPTRGPVPRPPRVHGVRHPDDRRDVPGGRGPGHRARGRGRPAQERAADADLRRRAEPPAVDHRLAAGPGPRLGDPCGGRRRGLPRRGHRRPRDGPGQPRGAPADRRPTSRRTTSCTPSTARCTTTSVAAATTSCCASRRSAAGR